MNILYIAAFDRPWSTETHAIHGLEELGHKVKRVMEKGLQWSTLPRQAAAWGDLVLWTHFHPGRQDEQALVLAALRRRGIPVVSYHLDRYWGIASREESIATDPFFQCLPGWTPVLAASAVAVSRRLYTGELVRIRARNHEMSATPNHPVLTRRGWIAAGLVQEGDHLVCDGRLNSRAAVGDPDVKHMPTTIEQVFEAACEPPHPLAKSRQRINPEVVNLHGEIPDSNVDVVSTADRLTAGGEFKGVQPVEDLRLLLAGAAQMHWAEPAAVVLGVAGSGQSASLADTPNGDPGVSENALDSALGARGDSERVGERLDRLASHVAPDNLVFDPISEGGVLAGALLAPPSGGADGYSTLRQLSSDRQGSNAAVGREGGQGLPSFVTLDQVHSVERTQFHGFVYNLSTKEGAYLADGIVTHNCDLVITADGGHADRWAELGIRHAWLPPGVHGPEVGRGTFRPEYAADVCFVGGSETYPHPEWREERLRLVGFLDERYGDRFKLWPADPRQPIRGRDLNDVFASTKVVVGDSCLPGGTTHYWSDRVPETLGRGGFLLHPWMSGIDDWYTDGEHLSLFDLGDLPNLGLLIDYWLDRDDERRKITDNAIALAKSRDTYTHRMAALLELAAADPVRRGWVDGRVGVREMSREGVTARFDLRPGTSDSVAVREVWQQGAYRLERAHVEGGLVVDVGAHVGAFSIMALAMGAKHVLAVEPNPENRSGLAANLDLNRPLTGAVSILPSALCDDCDEALMVFDGSGSHLSTDAEDGEPVMMTTLLEGVSGWLLRIGEVNADIAFLKMDCEGCEYASLDSLDKVLPRVRRAVFEFHGPAMPHLSHIDTADFGALCVVLAEHGTFEVVGRASTGGMAYWVRHG